MGTVHKLPRVALAQIRLIDEQTRRLAQQNASSKEAAQNSSLAEHPFDSDSTNSARVHPVLNLDTVDGLPSDQQRAISAIAEQWLFTCFEGMNDQLRIVHSDLLALQQKTD